MVFEVTQNCHRNDGRGDGGCEGQARLQAEVYVRCGEDDGDDATDNDASQGQFLQRRPRRLCCLGHITGLST